MEVSMKQSILLRENKKAFGKIQKPFIVVVAGTGFEPATSGL